MVETFRLRIYNTIDPKWMVYLPIFTKNIGKYSIFPWFQWTYEMYIHHCPDISTFWNTKLRPFTCWDPIFSFAKLSAFFLRPRVRGAKNRRHSEREPVFLLAGFLNAPKMVNVERTTWNTWKWLCLHLFFSGIHGNTLVMNAYKIPHDWNTFLSADNSFSFRTVVEDGLRMYLD